MMWTAFYDNETGGLRKEKFTLCLIEADRETAIKRFEAIFGRDPPGWTCEYCSEDYDIVSYPTLEAATSRRRFGGESPEAYFSRRGEDVRVIDADELATMPPCH